MKSYYSFFVELLILQCLAIACGSQGYNFFYFVQQWPGSSCDTAERCCYPTTGKPATNFSIHGFWPYYQNGSHETYCDSNNPLDLSKISDLNSNLQVSWPSLACPSRDSRDFWSQEWDKSGTCSESRYVPSQHAYFQQALTLKNKVNILRILENAGIRPNGAFYGLTAIRSVLNKAIGYEPWIKCNTDASGNSQLFQIYLCAGRYQVAFVECPVLPKPSTGDCASAIKFPAF